MQVKDGKGDGWPTGRKDRRPKRMELNSDSGAGLSDIDTLTLCNGILGGQ